MMKPVKVWINTTFSARYTGTGSAVVLEVDAESAARQLNRCLLSEGLPQQEPITAENMIQLNMDNTGACILSGNDN